MKVQQMCLMFCLFSVLWAAPAIAKMRLSSGVRVNTFTEDLQDTEGMQTLIPLEFSYARGKLTLMVKSGYAHTELTRPQQDRAELSTVTDTLVSASYTISTQPVAFTCGLTLNLPTGKERLSADEEPVTDGDFDLRQFGEGVNVGLNVSAIKVFGPLTTGINAAYSYRGDYTPGGEEDALDPGDQLLFAGKFTWKAAPPLKIGVSAAYLHATPNQIQAADDFQNGDLFILGQTVEYRPRPLEFSLIIQQTLPQKAKYATDGDLQAEPDEGVGNTWATTAALGYQYSPALNLKLLGNIRVTGESPRKDTTTGKPYAGRKIVYSLGPNMQYQINKALSCQVNASYVVQEKEPSATTSGNQTTTGFKVNTGVSYTF